jgi:hypothetical protein
MSTPHSIPRAPRFRIGLGPLLTSLGVLIAIATTITFIALTGANHTTAATPAAPSQAAVSSTTHIQYLGPQQQNVQGNPQTAQSQGSDSTPTADAGNLAPHYTCLGAAHHCLP